MLRLLKRFKQGAKEKGISSLWGLACFFIRYIFCHYVLCVIARHAPNVLVPTIHRWRGMTIGKDVYIDSSVYLDSLYPELITVEEGARLTAHAVLICHFSAGQKMKERFVPMQKKPITIKKHAFVGSNATILPGVTINEFAIVGAGSVVTKDVSPYTVVIGNPARPIRTLTSS